MYKRTKAVVLVNLLLVTTVLLANINVQPAHAAPADPFTGASPSFDATLEEGVNYNLGDWGVADQRGAATYTFPIAVPPGRNVMAPSLALRYSSQSPLRGGIAAGWALDLPNIELDHSLGADGGVEYKASVGSAMGRLIEVPDDIPYEDGVAAYRVDFDNAFTRFFMRQEKHPFYTLIYWTALTQDGVRHHFTKRTENEPDPRWLIDQEVDPFGNTIQYFWMTGKDYHLERIEYSANAKAGLAAHARVTFEYAPPDLCAGSDMPIGAAIRYGSIRTEGSQRLTAIKTYVRESPQADWRLSRETTLGYELRNSRLYEEEIVSAPDNRSPNPPTTIDCKQDPLRYLTQIDSTAYDSAGNATRLPPITFEYNNRFRTTGEFPGNTGPLQPVSVVTPGYFQYGTSGRKATGTQSDWMDIDGDGLRDLVSVTREADVCTLVWQKGVLGGSFETTEHKSPLPTVAWYSEWKGHPAPQEVLENEGCTLNGQIAYRDYEVHTPGSPSSRVLGRGVVSYHFLDYTGDGRLDLLTNVWATSCHQSYVPFSMAPPPTDNRLGCDFANPVANVTTLLEIGSEPPPSSPGFVRMSPDTGDPASEGPPYIWHVYRGTGNLSDLFDSSYPLLAMRVSSRVALPPSASDERLDDSLLAEVHVPPLIDLDGDGFLDIIDAHQDEQGCTLLGFCDWMVHLGQGGGTFTEMLWKVPRFGVDSHASLEKGVCGLEYVRVRTTLADLRDVNGDGLSDLLVLTSEHQLKAYLNRGTFFSNIAREMNVTGLLERTQTDCKKTSQQDLVAGRRGFLQRLIDLDSDGLLDVLVVENGDIVEDISADSVVHAHFNLGGVFGPLSDLPAAWQPAKRLLEADIRPVEGDPNNPSERPDPLAGEWHTASDFTDVTGDGYDDLVQWEGDSLSYISSPGLPEAADLLSAVENGRGMRIEFQYAPSTDPEVVRWTGQNSPLLPYVSWVVSQATVKAGFDDPSMVTHYEYQDPRYLSPVGYTGVAERGRFAGFSHTILTTASNDSSERQVSREYAYQAVNLEGDIIAAPEGFLVKELTYQDGELHEARQLNLETVKLFSGEVQTTLSTGSLTCTAYKPDLAPEECMARAENVHRIVETWIPVTPSTWDDQPEPCEPNLPCQEPLGPELYIREDRVEGRGPETAPADRLTHFEYDVRYGQNRLTNPCQPPLPCELMARDDYRLLMKMTTRKVIESGNLLRQSETIYDELTGLPVRSREWLDADTIATTTRLFDPATGNLLSVTKPTQQPDAGGSGAITHFEYDPYELFVERTMNELGYVMEADYDLATGAMLARRGPNSVKVGETTVWDEERWTVDGFGRVLTHSISLDDPRGGYVQKQIEELTYEDGNFHDNGKPNLVRQKQLIKFNSDVTITTERRLDGLGRVLAISKLLSEGRPAETTYSYDDRGNLAAIEIPDPSNELGRVRYQYTYDARGRLIHFTRPDGSGLRISYAGLNETRCEVTADGSGGCKRQVFDVFGRLFEVREDYPGAAPGITRYYYDGNDNLHEIIDAEKNVTTLKHDMAGRRLEIRRGDRIWQYDYDLDGNMIVERAPSAAGEDPKRQTVHYEYDDLGRVKKVTYGDISVSTLPEGGYNPGSAVLPSEPLIGTIQYIYDQGRNGLGRLSQVVLPFGEVQYEYDARGLVTQEQRSFSLPMLAGQSPVSVTQSVKRDYNALGQLTESRWDDGSRWQMEYDARGMVLNVRWYDPEAKSWKMVAHNNRTLAGLVRQRDTDFGQTRVFTYDSLGRPRTDTVTLKDGTIAGERLYDYSDSGDLTSVTGRTNGLVADSTYTYDAQHRLLTAAGPNGYQGEFTYSPSGNLLTAEVNWPGSNETRKVKYEYGAVDPQAVDQLVNLDDGKAYANFDYDPAGRMTLRETPAGTTALTWNAMDQLRLAHGPHGAELYFYDHIGARVLAINRQDGIRFWFGESETHYDLNGVQTRRYLHISDGGSVLARVENGTKLELQYADALQNLMFSLDSEGKVAASFLYGPFGEVVSQNGAEDHRRQFNGKENDELTGLRYYGYRYYDPLSLRWNSADPLYRFVPDLGLGEPQRMNVYTFSLNNPIRYYDPDGRLVDPDPFDRCTAENTCHDPWVEKCNDPQTFCDEGDSPQQGEEADQEEYGENAVCEEEEQICTVDEGNNDENVCLPEPNQCEIDEEQAKLDEIKEPTKEIKQEVEELREDYNEAKRKNSWQERDFAYDFLDAVIIGPKSSDTTLEKIGKFAYMVVSPPIVAGAALSGHALNELRNLVLCAGFPCEIVNNPRISIP